MLVINFGSNVGQHVNTVCEGFFLKYIITDLKESGISKVQLRFAVNFIFSKDIDEEEIVHSKSDNIEVMTHNNANEVVNEIFESLLSKYQICLKATMKGSNFIFDGVS